MGGYSEVKCIIHAALVLDDRLVGDGTVIFDEDKITYAGEACKLPENAEIIDAKGAYVGPGFIDIHCHGGGVYSSGDYPQKYADYFLQRGTTSVLATLSYGEEPQARLVRAHRIVEAMKDTPSILGIHLEGPFKNPNFGFPGKYQTPATLENAVRIFDACEGHAMLMMVGPDTENMEPILAEMQKRGIKLSAGHGTGDEEHYALMKKYGLIDATHHYCASGDYQERKGVRKVGLDELVDLDDDVYAEIIADHVGAHVAPKRIQLCIKCKGADKIILVTDSVPKIWNQNDEDDPEAKIHDLSPTAPHRAEDCDIHWVDGKLDGSELNMAKACYNMKRHSGQPTEVVWRMASLNPAKMLDVNDRVGSLKPGLDADILIADGEFNVKTVISKGRIIR